MKQEGAESGRRRRGTETEKRKCVTDEVDFFGENLEQENEFAFGHKRKQQLMSDRR